jgi:hypothetical protein
MNPARIQGSAAVIIVLSESTLETGRQTRSSSGEAAPFFGALRGLCVSCDLRPDCTYPKAPGGVWNCDEYV